MSIALKIIKRLIITLFMLFILAVVVFLLWRIVSSGAPKNMETLVPDASLSEIYGQDGDIYMFRQEQRSITSTDKNYGYFAITDYAVIPKANQLQAVFRYNNSTLRSTAEDFSLPEAPPRDAQVYDVTLLLAIDLTPDNPDDNFGNSEESVSFVRCHGRVVASEQKNVYNFRKLVFDFADAGVDIASLIDQKLLLAIYADFYYTGALDYSADPYGTLCLYDFQSKNVKVDLTKKDIAALKEYE